MNNNLSDITILLDRSGSMASIADDTIGGFNKFLQSQKDAPGEAVLSLHQFDHEYLTVIDAKDIKSAKKLDHESYVPRGNTALLDAVGRSVVSTGERLAKMDEKDRPGKVVFVIITDGQENSSKEYTLAKVKEMIKHQRENYKWEFVFLGADQDAFLAGTGLGVVGANTMKFAKNSIGTQAFYAATADNLTAFRTGTKLDLSYTADQHDDQKKAGA